MNKSTILNSINVLINILFTACIVFFIAQLFDLFGLRIDEYQVIVNNTGKIIYCVISFVLLRVFVKIINYYIDLNKSNDAKIKKETLYVLKYFIITLLSLAFLENLGYSINSILALSGIGGAILAFAAKDTISNLFGFATIYLDKPFSVGDQITCEQHKVSGVVKKIGVRTTEIIRLDKKPVYVPNGLWAAATIINSSRKTNREIELSLPLQPTTSSKLDEISSKIKQFLLTIEDVDKKSDIHVFTDNIDSYGFHMKIHLYTINMPLKKYYALKQSILHYIIDLLESNKCKIHLYDR